MHAIAAKAVCFGEALKPEFKVYAKQVVVNAKAMAKRLMERGLRLVSGGTDNHLMLIDLRAQKRTGKQVQDVADTVGITLNRNSIPYDEASKFNPSGVRVGTPLVTTRGMREAEMVVIADCIADLIERIDDRADARLGARARAGAVPAGSRSRTRSTDAEPMTRLLRRRRPRTTCASHLLPGLWPLLVAFAVCAVAVPLMIWLSRRTGMIAQPGDRHAHPKPTPLLGGLAMYLGFAAALILFLPRLQGHASACSSSRASPRCC